MVKAEIMMLAMERMEEGRGSYALAWVDWDSAAAQDVVGYRSSTNGL